MSVVKEENYIHISGWMVTRLGLKGNELLIYAIIYGFSQTKGQNFTGSLKYLAEWTNSSKQGVMKNLKSLIEKNLITKSEKTVNGVKYCEYHTTEFNDLYNKVVYPIQQSLTGGIQQSLHNNIDNNIQDDNKMINNNDQLASEFKSEFEEIWKSYPKKQGKASALKAYIKARKNGSEKAIIEVGLSNYIRYIEMNHIEPRFIKQGSTWFTQECWNDEYIQTQAQHAPQPKTITPEEEAWRKQLEV